MIEELSLIKEMREPQPSKTLRRMNDRRGLKEGMKEIEPKEERRV